MAKQVKIWGSICDKQNDPLDDQTVKLLKKYHHHKRTYYKEIESYQSDEKGGYEFQVSRENRGSYKVIIV
ncbi:MAG: hypothetical protein ACRDDX_06900 [Cellulosilyticaceae bacterium]